MRRVLTVTFLALGVLLAVALVRLVLQAGPPPPPPRLIPDPVELDFGSVYVGQVSSRRVNYTNFSQQAATLISAGTGNAPFGFEATSFTGQVLAPGQTIRNLEFTFSPTAKGSFQGRGQVVRQPPGPQVNKVGLKGEGIYSEAHGDLSISDPRPQPQEFLDFENVTVGQNKTLSVVIHNGSAQARSVRVLFGGMSQAFDVVTPGRNFQIPARGSATVVIKFAPLRPIEYRSFILVEVMRSPGIPSADHYTGMMLRGQGVQGG